MESLVMLIIGISLGSIIVGMGIIYSKLNDRISDLEARVRAYQNDKIYRPYYRYKDYYADLRPKPDASYAAVTQKKEEEAEEDD